MKLLCCLVLALPTTFGATSWRELPNYSFDDYTREFKKNYVQGSSEWNYRKGLFNTRLSKILTQNQIPGKKFKLGVNKYTDLTEEEFHPMRFSQSHASLKHVLPNEDQQWAMLGASPGEDLKSEDLPNFSEKVRSHIGHHDKVRTRLRGKFASADWSQWPASLDWSKRGVMTQVHDQAGGSCWAHTAVEAMEAQAAIQHGRNPVDLSVQEIVSCVPNPRKCGGDGGCQGSIVELAFDYVKENGLHTKESYPFDHYGICTDSTCKSPSLLQSNNSDTLSLSSYRNLPANKLKPVMDALQRGPVAIAVSTDGWRDYEGGILEVTTKDVILGHAVLLVGYGEEEGEKYWKIRNSWGYWGEAGYIRLKRMNNPEKWCGQDTNAQAGTACEGDPSTVTVCGANGLLYDPVAVTSVGKI